MGCNQSTLPHVLRHQSPEPNCDPSLSIWHSLRQGPGSFTGSRCSHLLAPSYSAAARESLPCVLSYPDLSCVSGTARTPHTLLRRTTPRKALHATHYVHTTSRHHTGTHTPPLVPEPDRPPSSIWLRRCVGEKNEGGKVAILGPFAALSSRNACGRVGLFDGRHGFVTSTHLFVLIRTLIHFSYPGNLRLVRYGLLGQRRRRRRVVGRQEAGL